MYVTRVPLIVLLLTLCLTAKTVDAQGISKIDLKPTADGNMQMTVNGDGFGSKPNIVYYNDFRGDALYGSVSKAKQLAGTTAFGRNIPTIGVMDETKGFYAVDPVLDEPSILQAEFDKTYEDVFLAYSVGIPKGSTTPGATEPHTWIRAATWKMSWMLQSSSAYADNDQFDMCGSNIVYLNTALWGNASKFADAQDGATYTHANLNEWWAWDTFNHMQILFDGNLEVVEKSVGSFSVVNTKFKYVDFPLNTVSPGDPEGGIYKGPAPQISRINFPGWFRGSTEDRFQALYSNIYVSAGSGYLSRFELTDAKSYEKSTYRRVLFPTSWDSKTATFTLYLTELKRKGGLFVHYFNDKGERVGQGFNACEKCPEMGASSTGPA